jgi:hypothetical protein
MIELMKKAASNIESQSEQFYNQVPDVTSKYDWQKLTNSAMDSLISRVGIGMFENSGYFK